MDPHPPKQPEGMMKDDNTADVKSTTWFKIQLDFSISYASKDNYLLLDLSFLSFKLR